MIKNKNKFGFTLVEIILYIGIVSMILVSVSSLGWIVVSSGAKSRVQEEVSGTARYVAERISYEIRRASGIGSWSANSITLNNFAPDTTTVITWDSPTGKVRINKNGTGFVDLNSNDTAVTTLTFTNNTSVDNKTKNIGFTLTVSANTASGSQIYKSETTVRSTVELRSN